MDIRLLAMDLDGTSLQADHQSFTPRLRQALQDAHAQGVVIVPTTGRQYNFLPPAVQTGAAWEDLCVLCNGGEIRRISTGELLQSFYIAPELAVEVIRLADRYSIPVELSINGDLYLTQASLDMERTLSEFMSYRLDAILADYGVIVDRLEDTAQTPGVCIEKINLLFPPEFPLDGLCADLDQLPPSPCRSGPLTLEITHEKSPKGNGVLEVCRRLGIDPAHAMAMGDNGNDISMLQAAGFSVAMGNAEPHIQAVAKAVTLPYDQDGAALAIERYILHK